MARSSDHVTCPVSEAELAETEALMEQESGPVSPGYLRWWFFENPARLFSFFVLKVDGLISGMATMNGFKFATPDGHKLVGMPQKVLVRKELRGKGYFGELYFSSERDNLQKKSDFFLTFTNAASTPIFLGKFGYKRGICPDVVVIPFDPGALLKTARCSVVEAIDPAPGFAASLQFENGIVKDREFMSWRYSLFRAEQYVILRVEDELKRTLGWVSTLR